MKSPLDIAQFRLLVAAALYGLVALTSGCGSTESKDQTPRTPITGVVTLAGESLENVLIVFESKTPGVAITAPLAGDGKFEIKDSRGSGLPAGDYVVYFQAPPQPLPTPGNMDVTPPDPSDFVVPAKYRAAKTSGLTAKVESGKESVPLKFDLVK